MRTEASSVSFRPMSERTPESGEADPLDDSAEDRGAADSGLSDFVRRAVSAGVGAATRSKDDILRVASGEMRTWLERLDLDKEIVKALSKMVVEVKTEIRFRPTDDGKAVTETSNDAKIRQG